MLLSLPEFELLFSDSVEQTCALLTEHQGGAQMFAGGTDLFIKMKQRRFVPRCLINIKKIPGLDHIRGEANGGLRIGALTTIQSIKDSPVVARSFPVLNQTAGMLGTTQVRNLGTLGGNLANASPAAEFAPGLLVLEASVRCVGPSGERLIPLERFFAGPGKSALQPDEIITDVLIPSPPPQAQAVYLKHSLRRMDVSMAGAALLLVLEGDVCRDVRIALGAVAPVPFRARKTEDTLRGTRLTGDSTERDLIVEAARVASGESTPIDDIRGYAASRKRAVERLVREGLGQLIASARASVSAR